MFEISWQGGTTGAGGTVRAIVKLHIGGLRAELLPDRQNFRRSELLVLMAGG